MLTATVNAGTELCPNPNTFTGQADPDHYRYLPAGGSPTSVPSPCNSCDDPLNADFAACGVYRFMHSTACQGRQCRDTQGILNIYRTFKNQFALQYDIRYRDPVRYPRAEGENCRFLVWALNPSIGAEDIHTRTDYSYWNQAWRASQHLVKPSFPMKQVGFIVQSAITRGQHQLHIHIGRLFPDYRQAIDSLQQNPTVTQRIIIRDRLFYARYILNASGKGPFTGANPFDVASGIIPEGIAGIPEYGILAAIATNRKGVFVLAARAVERDQLNYRAKKACRLAYLPLKAASPSPAHSP
jgi:hypothetical protein